MVTYAKSEQSFSVENNLDINKLNADREKYIETLKNVAQDYLENGFYFKLTDKKIRKNYESDYNFDINLEVFLKKDVVIRNFSKSEIFKSKILTNEALTEVSKIKNPNSNDFMTVSFFSFGSNKRSYTCVVSRLKDENGDMIGHSIIIHNDLFFDFEDFTDPTLGGSNSFKELVRRGDILLAKKTLTYQLTLDEIAKIKNISVSAEKCDPNLNIKR